MGRPEKEKQISAMYGIDAVQPICRKISANGPEFRGYARRCVQGSDSLALNLHMGQARWGYFAQMNDK